MSCHPGITKRDISRFTTGDCHYLARALQKRTGWPIFCFRGISWDGKPDAPVTHAFVQMPDGRFLDVHGAQTKDEIRARWERFGAKEVGCFTWLEIRGPEGGWEGPFGGNYTYQRAYEIADRLLTLPEVVRASSIRATYPVYS